MMMMTMMMMTMNDELVESCIAAKVEGACNSPDCPIE